MLLGVPKRDGSVESEASKLETTPRSGGSSVKRSSLRRKKQQYLQDFLRHHKLLGFNLGTWF